MILIEFFFTLKETGSSQPPYWGLAENDTDQHHSLKTSYRDDIMKMCKAAFKECLVKTDISDAFKRNGLTNKLDGSEDHLLSSKIKALVWNEIKEFHSELISKLHPTTLKDLEKVMIPPDGVKQKLWLTVFFVVDSVNALCSKVNIHLHCFLFYLVL